MARPHLRRHRRALTAGAAALAVTTSAAAATGAVQSPAGASEEEQDTITIAVNQEVDSLSPFKAVRVITTNMHRWMYDFLTNYDPETGETIPALAEEWETSEDELTWTYHLREDATWSDGEPVTAEDRSEERRVENECEQKHV